MGRLILLTAPEFADTVAAPLKAAGADVHVAVTRADLEQALTPESRLVSFGAGIIVPGAVLRRVSGSAYNFHPGPPFYPGIFPSVFALYDGATEFGVTLHEMAEVVDSGPIIAVDSFAVPAQWDRLALDTAAFRALMTLLQRFAPALADMRAPLPRSAHTWSGARRTRNDFAALCHLGEDATAEEFRRRHRAIGEGPEHALTISRFGRTFRLTSTEGADVVRGGQPAR